MNTGFLGLAVATVLTVYGIETLLYKVLPNTSMQYQLQQYLPFTVLKLSTVTSSFAISNFVCSLQQYLPFTVLKLLVM